MPNPYLPLWEGQSGSVSISNQPGGSGYVFPALPNGGGVDYNGAASSLFSLRGDNSSWAGKIGIAANGSSGFNLTYNGASVDANIAVTNLSIQADDLAYFSASHGFDPYQVTSSGGGSTLTIPVYWLVNPSIASVTPQTLTGDGHSYTITVTLSKPMPPIQANPNATFSGGGGLNVTGVSPIIRGDGFLTGWTVTVTTPVVGSQIAVSLSLDLTDTITYLSGTGITTTAVTYLNSQITSLQITGAAPTTISPVTILNGWSSHVGDYEGGVSQSHNWTTGAANAYSNPTNAIDGNASTYADATLQHTHLYAGCVWAFTNYLGYTVVNGTLAITSMIPNDGTGGLSVNNRSAGIWYSLDGGGTWTNIYNQGPRAYQTDTITLPNGQDLSQVQIMAFTDSHDDMVHYVHEINVNGVVVPS